ncbi:protein kinase [Nocardiopsis nanhaiensis]
MDTRIIDLIHPHTGQISSVEPIEGGFGVSTTALVEAKLGRFFVKATPNREGGHLDAARREALVGPFLAGVAPAFRFCAEDPTWVVIGVDALNARPTDFTPDSADLAVLVQALDRITALGLPAVAQDWVDTRWDRFATPEEIPYLRGQALTHADLHGRNILVDGQGRAWVVDWEWPTCASAALMPTSLAVQLVSAGHSPKGAQTWVEQTTAWSAATAEELRVCAAVTARMQDSFAKRWPEEQWLTAMADAADAWAEHLS